MVSCPDPPEPPRRRRHRPLRNRPATLAEPDLAGLSDITGGDVPIGAAERTDRLTRAQALMKANGIGAVVIEPGASLVYFTGVNWWRSERLTCAVIPAEGQPCVVTPFFEEPSVRRASPCPRRCGRGTRTRIRQRSSRASCATVVWRAARWGSRRRCASSRSTA
ncbi:aminopeptidase P family N-terminal domain-containing protein [Sphingomonas sp. MMS24-JH45]